MDKAWSDDMKMGLIGGVRAGHAHQGGIHHSAASSARERGAGMPTRSEVWAIADRLRAKPERVSIRSVRDALPRGGSYRVIGEHLAAWKAERHYQPRLELAQLPEALQEELASFGKRVWEASMREATRQFEADRDRLEGLRLHDQKLRDEALAGADAAEGRIAAAEAKAERLAAELAAAREEARGLRRKMSAVRPTGADAEERRRAERARSRAFWEKVMGEAQAALARIHAAGGGLTRDQILKKLSRDLREEATATGEDLGVANLSKRLDERVLRGKFFTKKDGVYRLRTAA